MIENLKDLKDIYETAKQQLTRGREPLDEFIKLNACLKAVVEDPQVMIFEKMDAEYRKFFFETLAAGALKSITREKSRDEKVSTIDSDHLLKCPINTSPAIQYLEVMANILENYTRLFLALLKLG